jgi:hypothetical protein
MRTAAAIVIISNCLLAEAMAQTAVDVTVGEPIGKVQLDFGITYTQQTLRSDQNPDAVKSAKSIMRRVAHYQNVHIMGWGTRSPEPSPGAFDWEGLDRRIAIVRETGGVPVITLCCAADWMKGGREGETDWSKLTVAPLPEHFKDFAALARQVALRYPDVKHYQVWNEFKGFWNRSEHRWDYEGYTEFYNLVYDALKSVSADIKVGGPYTPMDHSVSMPPGEAGPISGPYGTVSRKITDAFQYWMAHKHGADFVTIDGHIRPKDGRVDDIFAAIQFYADIDNWIRQQTKLPIWWAEWYTVPDPANSIPDNLADAYLNALMTATLVTMAPTASVALRWGPEESDQSPYLISDQEGLWNSTLRANGGQPRPFESTVEKFEHCFPRDQTLLATHVRGQGIIAMASPECVLLINRTAAAINVNLAGKAISLDPFGVNFLALPQLKSSNLLGIALEQVYVARRRHLRCSSVRVSFVADSICARSSCRRPRTSGSIFAN